MRKINKIDKAQMELSFQTKEIAPFAKLVQNTKTAQSVTAKHLNINLPNKTSSSKFKKSACRQQKRPQALFFENLTTVEELAVIFGLAPQTIRNWVAQGKLPYVKIGKRNLFLMRSVQEWLNRKEIPQWQ